MEPEFFEFEVAADSGCAKHVADKLRTPNYSRTESSMSRAGRSFVAAGGDEIPKEGDVHLRMQSDLRKNVDSTF